MGREIQNYPSSTQLVLCKTVLVVVGSSYCQYTGMEWKIYKIIS